MDRPSFKVSHQLHTAPVPTAHLVAARLADYGALDGQRPAQVLGSQPADLLLHDGSHMPVAGHRRRQSLEQATGVHHGRHRAFHVSRPPGLFAGERFRAGTVTLEPGDSLVLYTDGVVEPADAHEAEFGEERLEAAIRAASDRPASEALRSVIEATRAFSGHDRYDDDFTLVVVKRSAGAR